MEERKRRIAIIGAGISGISAAYRLQQRYDLTLFEKNTLLGGHTSTVVVESGEDEGLAVDTGFIVLNNKNYPRLHRFFRELGVSVRESDMSFGFSCEKSGFCYAGTTLNGLFAQRSNIFDSQFWSMLWGILQFCRRGGKGLKTGEFRDDSLNDLIRKLHLNPKTVNDYILPMGAAIWSAPSEEIRDFPAEAFLRFFENHGLLGVRDRPQWQTVVGGSHTYVKRFEEKFQGTVRLSEKIHGVSRSASGVKLRTEQGGEEHFDAVVFASHADETLQMLDDPSEDEKRLLGPWSYQVNHTVLHTDVGVLPKNRRAWASWNYLREQGETPGNPVSVTYDMNRLQGLKTRKQYCVTLNRSGSVRPESVIREFYYYHPCYSGASMRTQSELSKLQGMRNSYFCGSYFGYGFHEDGIRSGENVAELLGCHVS